MVVVICNAIISHYLSDVNSFDANKNCLFRAVASKGIYEKSVKHKNMLNVFCRTGRFYYITFDSQSKQFIRKEKLLRLKQPIK